MIRLCEVRLAPSAEQRVLDVLRSGQLAQGSVVAEFERQFALLAGTRHAVAVSSGTTALVAALEALHLEPGDEVLTSPFTFVATLNAILEAGAVARFVDIGSDFTLDADLVEDGFRPGTRVIMPVHLYGYPADMDRISGIARTRGVAIVEDAAQAHGAVAGGRQIGSFGVGCFSFYATKNLTTGEGGMITTDDDQLADRLRLLRGQGMREQYVYEIVGHNYRMTEVQAAIGLAELGRIDELTEARRRHAAQLAEGLSTCPGIAVPTEKPGRLHVYHQFTIRVTSDARMDRDSLHKELLRQGIESGVYYPRTVFDYPCYRAHPGVEISPVPVAERAAAEVLSLPVHPWLSARDVSRIVEVTQEVLGS